MSNGNLEEAVKRLVFNVKNLGDFNPVMKEWSDQVLKNFDVWRKEDWFDNYERKKDKDVENYLPMPKVNQHKQEDYSVNNLTHFVLWLQDNHVQVGRENCERGYVIFEDLHRQDIQRMAEMYLQECPE